MPIGVLDSGVGGLSILAVLEKKFPDQQFIYLSDQKNFPYSEKSVDELRSIAVENVRVLQSKGCNPMVLACNTLSVIALAHLRQTFPELTFIGTVPAVKPASEELPKNADVIVLATKNTVESGYLQNLVAPFSAKTNFTLLGSTKLVAAIENWDPTAITQELNALFLPLLSEKKIAGVVLGCTHFAFIEDMIKKVLNAPVAFFEPSEGITKQLQKFVPVSDSATPATKTQFFSTLPDQNAGHVVEQQYTHLQQFLQK